ncbi:hypothetical protein K443DRAFT_650319 [Laccaria amethystina LaAM-08-1]|uniref:Nephrocystin 3-like N-terminal domain-containing protein n=1 Tax=Laccaria amethystina LaAM-08-1 TaxID=1095629 RepID=A0A0C9WNS2_9AGAR|nr:hypothetical protein K443DRAFT_650319 [Laccaria amethystina LaAM-08-1]
MSPSPPALFQNAHDTNISGNPQFNTAGRDIVVNVHESRSSARAALPDLLRPVSDATHTRAGHVPRCDPGTRLEVIAQIRRWLDGHDNDKRAVVCWLNGPAGYGKSALAQTIAESYAAERRLLGSFFFLRGAGERSHISRLIPTLAHQISLTVPGAKPLIESALEDEPALLGSTVSLAHRLQRLIIDPIHLNTSRVSCSSEDVSSFVKKQVVVIDALDECDNKVEMADFIDVLLSASSGGTPLPFWILLTSRVEEHIRKKFDSSEARFLHRLELENFDARLDIKVYFQRGFGCIYDQNWRIMQSIPKPWPSFRDLTALLDKAGSSFAFATTLIQHVSGDRIPDKALQRLLASGVNGLDSLYEQVLSSASWTEDFCQILGTIMVLKNNESISFFSSLLSLHHQEVICELLEVQSIIKIPGDDNEPIMLYHTSLRDFLTTKSRSKQYFIDPPLQHLHLAIHCLKHLAEYPSKDFFEGDVAKYACFNWPRHLLLGFQEQELNVDETIMNSLVTLIKNLLTFQGKTWYNTLQTFDFYKKARMLNYVRDGRDLFQVSYCNYQMVITLITCIRHCRGQLLQRISLSNLNKLLISVK